MLARYRLFLIVAGLSVVIGLAVALERVVTFTARQVCTPGRTVLGGPNQPPTCYVTTGPGPDWIAGFWTAVVVYALLVGLILSARALRTK